MAAFRRLMVGEPTTAAAATTTNPLSLPPPPFPLPPAPPRVEVDNAAFAANAAAHQAATTTPLPASPRPSALVLLDLFSPPASPKAIPGSEPVKK